MSGQDVFDRFFALSLDMLCIAGADGYFKRLSPAFDKLGYSREELLARPFLDFVHPDDHPATVAEMERLSRGEATISFENRYRCSDGSYRWLVWNVAPDGSGLLYALARDVTEQKQAQAQTREANQFLEAIFEHIPHMVFVKDAERLAFVRFNRAGEALLGISREALIGRNDHDFFPASEAEFFEKKDREALAGTTTVDIAEEAIQTRRGMRLLHTKKVPILDDSGKPRFLLGISEDVTERRADEEVRARLAAIVKDSADAIIGSSVDGIVTSWNGSAERIFGFSAEEMVGRPATALLPAGHDAESARMTEQVIQGGQVPHYEAMWQRKDGQEIEVVVTLSPVRDTAGRSIGVSKIIRDITEAKRAQRELVQAKESAENANRELEAFSYSVAHDLRAPLRSIDGFSQAILEDYAEKLDDAGKRYLGLVRGSVQLMGQLIDDILTLSRVTRASLVVETVDLSAIANTVLSRLVEAEPGRRVQVTVESGITARGDSRLLAVLLGNLLGNAWKFSGRRDAARIEFGVTPRDDARVYFVRDNGAGFDSAFVGKLFGVFQRLHSSDEFEGTGVGLATVQRIVHRHGGRVWAEGQVEMGATFYFTLGDDERRTP